ncbi:MAG: sulfatase-like hydrolase/transferase [Myxococcaceae bacterium]|nr:sulfatase-like hydrolase/transferase [Myxococcaceae bacterium]
MSAVRAGKSFGLSLGVGAVLGLALFAAEARLILQSQAIGLGIDTEGPFAAFLRVVKPALTELMWRVGAAYMLAGAALAATVFILTAALGVKKYRWVVWLAQFVLMSAAWAYLRAVQRPALFDDLAWARGLLGWLVVHGQPWQGQAALFACFAVPMAVGAWRWRRVLSTAGLTLRLYPRWGVVALAVGAVGWGVHMLRAWARPVPPPLVWLVGIDALRPDRLKAYGATRTVAPHLDALLEEAIVFEKAYTPIAQTEPAWRSLLAAQWPTSTGVRHPLTSEGAMVPLTTFPQVLNAAGVATYFATDCSRFNFQSVASGFMKTWQPPRGAVNFALEKMRFRAVGVFADNALGAWWLPELVENRAMAGIYSPWGYAERLGDTLLDASAAGPSFVAVHATAAHFPGDPSYPFYRAQLGPEWPLEQRLRMSFAPVDGAGGVRGPRDPEKARQAAEGLYDELIAQADAQWGQWAQALKDTGRFDSAWIVVFSDHGESFHEDRPELAGATPVHGARLGEIENHIVLAVKPPKAWKEHLGSSVPRRVAELVRLIDVGPTVLDMLQAPPLPRPEGVSLMPLLEGHDMPANLLYAETGFTHVSPSVFDPAHYSGAPRSFEAYRVLSDGVVEMTAEAHRAVLREKDRGAFDGEHWLIEAPMHDGRTEERCTGNCDSLREFLHSVIGPKPLGPSGKVGTR